MLREGTASNRRAPLADSMSAGAGRNPGVAPNLRSEWPRPADTRVASRTARGPIHERVGLRARDSVQRIARTWTATAETDECLGSKRATAAALTRTVTG